MLWLICLLFASLFIILFAWSRRNAFVLIEGIDSSKSTMGSPAGSTTKAKFKGTFDSSFNGRMAVNDMYFADKVFDNVVYYPNTYEEDDELNNVVNTGWLKCKEQCNGNCIEFGLSGASFCFN